MLYLFSRARFLREKFCAVRMRNAILRNYFNSIYYFSVRVTSIFHDHISHHSYRGLKEPELSLAPTSKKGFFNLTPNTIRKSLLTQQFIVNASILINNGSLYTITILGAFLQVRNETQPDSKRQNILEHSILLLENAIFGSSL